MNINKLNMLAAILALALIVSLAINVLLLSRPRQPDKQEEKWVKSNEQFTKEHQNTETLSEKESSQQALENKTPIDSTARDTVSSEQKTVTQLQKEEATENNEIFEESIQSLLIMGIKDDFPELNLSDSKLHELTGTVISIRESMQALRDLERTSENAESFNQLQDHLDEARNHFERITGMSLTTFMLHSHADGGLDNDRLHDEEIVFEYLSDYRE